MPFPTFAQSDGDCILCPDGDIIPTNGDETELLPGLFIEGDMLGLFRSEGDTIPLFMEGGSMAVGVPGWEELYEGEPRWLLLDNDRDNRVSRC